jgi:hypothetical protein
MLEVDLQDVYFYYINPDKGSKFSKRRSRMEEILKELDIKYERFCPKNSDITIVEVAMAHRDIAKCAIDNKKFPFVILEDDCEINAKLPDKVLLPECDIIYWGASTYNAGQGKLNLSYFNDKYYRVKKSLSTHAILLIDKNAANNYINLANEAIEKKQFLDLHLAKKSENLVFITPKDGPYFYQSDKHTQPITQFLWEEMLNDIHCDRLF